MIDKAIVCMPGQQMAIKHYWITPRTCAQALSSAELRATTSHYWFLAKSYYIILNVSIMPCNLKEEEEKKRLCFLQLLSSTAQVLWDLMTTCSGTPGRFIMLTRYFLTQLSWKSPLNSWCTLNDGGSELGGSGESQDKMTDMRWWWSPPLNFLNGFFLPQLPGLCLCALRRLPHLNIKGHWKHTSRWLIPSRLCEESFVMSRLGVQSRAIRLDIRKAAIIDLVISNAELIITPEWEGGCQLYRYWMVFGSHSCLRALSPAPAPHPLASLH